MNPSATNLPLDSVSLTVTSGRLWCFQRTTPSATSAPSTMTQRCRRRKYKLLDNTTRLKA